MSAIADALDRVSHAIQQAAKRSGRSPGDITLIAASKTTTPAQVESAINWGIRYFGENRVQESIKKFIDTGLIRKIEGLHLIGPLQSNKVKKAVGVFDVIHSVDSLKLGEKINQAAQKLSIQQKILIQVNIGAEQSKHGASIEETPRLAAAFRTMPNLSLRGLMAIPPMTESAEKTRAYFSALRHLGHDLGLYQFSMGMSSDFEIAIEEGASWIRVGTAIFGRRTD